MRLLSSLILLFLSLSLLHAQDRKSPHYRQAVENARLDAQRNLAETLLGILIEFGTEIKDFRSRRDFILATVQGKLQGVSFSAPSYEERSGILRIRAQISRSDALEALKASEIDAGSSLPETIDALGEAIYEEPPLVPALDPNDSSTSTPPSPLDENTSTSPVLALRPLAFELPYQELLDILMYKLELSWTKSEQEEILKVLRSRSKVYLGLETSGGLQLQLRLESLAIELILQAYVWDYELYERALHFSKIHFKKGILLTCLLRGNQIFPLSNRLSSWYEAPLELTYRLAQYLSGSAEKAPSQRLLKQLEEGATFYFVPSAP
jgi:hypothetical protein